MAPSFASRASRHSKHAPLSRFAASPEGDDSLAARRRLLAVTQMTCASFAPSHTLKLLRVSTRATAASFIMRPTGMGLRYAVGRIVVSGAAPPLLEPSWTLVPGSRSSMPGKSWPWVWFFSGVFICWAACSWRH
ncbi:hypothetical protein FSY59_12245 [Comamonas sp. Z3]|nr:hypothetical protein FSY59_18435 [Comamonas sp. Z3]TYK70333.1 hypothetical protein FSY59_12245 [Comamonas sp. Z3]